ncbi:hypothetical protein [Gordonia polyisoprenivorans]|uniref:Uncharacterized protein n=1 Tax=Gordonia polyisoprenivorans TaxID=84595 RepID=A0A846WTR9_9ACTN|nr:hypothetical protein [Gordonia polyisoprenivorans]NKY04517.1 hypothetical protein [Gordonia polyisoprenivorans]
MSGALRQCHIEKRSRPASRTEYDVPGVCVDASGQMKLTTRFQTEAKTFQMAMIMLIPFLWQQISLSRCVSC